MKKPRHPSYTLVLTIFCALLIVCSPATIIAAEKVEGLRDVITHLSGFPTRATGSEGYTKSAEYIERYLENLGLEPESYFYSLPRRQHGAATMQFDNNSAPLRHLLYNAITPQAIDKELQGPLYWLGKARLPELDGYQLKGAIVLLDFDSALNWQQLAALGVQAIIYLDRQTATTKYIFQQKEEITPLQLPCFWMGMDEAERLLGPLNATNTGRIKEQVQLRSSASWQETMARNIYCLIPGTDPELKNELLMVEAFFDSSEYVAGFNHGADEAVSMATLLEVARSFAAHPPARSVLLLATSGHAQTLAGMRDLVWSMQAKKKELKQERKRLRADIEQYKQFLATSEALSFPLTKDRSRDQLILTGIQQSLKASIDTFSRQLIQLRMSRQEKDHRAKIDAIGQQRFLHKRLGWANSLHTLPVEEQQLLSAILPTVQQEYKTKIRKSKRQLKALKSALFFRQLIDDYTVASIVSLHLSSHGNGIGGFDRGALYQLKPTINRTGIYSQLAEIFLAAGQTSGATTPFIDTLRPDRLRNWDSWFLDTPALGGEIGSMAGFLGVSLVTLGDSRQYWGTPWDTLDNVNFPAVHDQARLIEALLHAVAAAPKLHSGKLPRKGFASLTGRANLLLQGELFANFPAEHTTLLASQGRARFYATVDHNGLFTIKGMADKKNVYDKLIIEGYKFDPESGQVVWAIDKKETGKDRYRLKIIRKTMKTELILFSCRQTTIFDLLEPRSLQYMTKLHILDGRRDAPPQHYWFSRIDTRASTIASIYTEPGTWLKLTLSDTVLTRKLLLSNGSAKKTFGYGYPVDDYDAIYNTAFYAARDAWTLLTPRIDNLEQHGIFDKKINSLQERGVAALNEGAAQLSQLHYSRFKEAAAESLALAARVYVQIEKTQKDVLFGVLFYIALFIPFAFCMERFLFNFSNIYKQITAFSVILVVLIAIIYSVHPAFKLAYSPMVVILAFFILGLSFMVTLIIFLRFEEEMILLQRRATHKRPTEISHWKAFIAAFFLGVSNLRRRRLRTSLTCLTLIILTFTIMSFTTLKSGSKHNRLFFEAGAPYQGLLLKKVNWQSLPPQAMEFVSGSSTTTMAPAPRVWLEATDPTQTVHVPLRKNSRTAELQGLIGLSPAERTVTNIDTLLSSGRWFQEDDHQTIILEQQMAETLQVSAEDAAHISLWGMEFQVIGTFKAAEFEQFKDLDGETLTPVTFPDESTDMSEVEQEAMESGEDIRSFQSRYRHVSASQTAIIPAKTLLSMGGHLKNIALRPPQGLSTNDLAEKLVDRFSLAIFTGEEDGVWLYNISDTMQYSGVPNIIIPLLISIFIVLNTMISSVYERKSEIAVYTSVGLAPSHVSFLFVAEAIALAVISVVLGYLLAQVSAALFATTSYWDGITVNYSSMAGVAAMVLVIGVVLISVIYPSRVAARIAIPDVNRSFKLPRPEGNTLNLTLPFFMKYEEHASIGGYIFSYLQSHQDVSHGIFSTGAVDLVYSCSTVTEMKNRISLAARPSDTHCIHLRAKMWLAPFDFGIMQWVDIQFCPAQTDHNYLEIKVTIERRSGEAALWQRINVTFLHELRKQLLVWRSLDDAGHDEQAKYLQRVAAEKAFSQLEEEEQHG